MWALIHAAGALSWCFVQMDAAVAFKIKAEHVYAGEHFDPKQIHASASGIERIRSSAGVEFRVLNLAESFKEEPVVFLG